LEEVGITKNKFDETIEYVENLVVEKVRRVDLENTLIKVGEAKGILSGYSGD